MIAPCLFEHVGDELGRNRSTTLVLLVLACIEKVRNDGRHSARTGRLACIDHDEQLHQRRVWRGNLTVGALRHA